MKIERSIYHADRCSKVKIEETGSDCFFTDARKVYHCPTLDAGYIGWLFVDGDEKLRFPLQGVKDAGKGGPHQQLFLWTQLSPCKNVSASHEFLENDDNKS